MTAAEQLKKAEQRAKREVLERTFRQHLMAAKLQHGWVTEYLFHPVRKWRFDFANPEIMLAVEIEGGVYSGGRHTRGAGFESDVEKYNAAEAMGWTLFRFTGGMVKTGKAIMFLEDYLSQGKII